MCRLAKISFILMLWLIAEKTYAACNVSTTGINFGSYDVFNASPTDATSMITIDCDEAPPPDVTISIGQSLYSGVMDPRKMKNLTGSYLLDYNIYTDAAKTSIWGDGTGGTATIFLKNVTKNKPRMVTGYGSIPPAQNATVGSYGDVLTVTILW